MSKRIASSILIGAVAVLLMFSPVWAGPLTSKVTDPEGDLIVFQPCVPMDCAPIQDIVKAEVANKRGIFLFSMDVAEAIPDSPEVPPGVTFMTWSWLLEVNPATFPAGYPLPPGFATPFEFEVTVTWDGTSFSGEVVDRRPLLVGEEVVITPIPLKIKRAEITAVVDGSLLADAASFKWVPNTALWFANDFPTFGGAFVDSTEFFVTWPQ